MIKLFEHPVHREIDEPVPFCWKVLIAAIMAFALLVMIGVCVSCQEESAGNGEEGGQPATIQLQVKGEEQADMTTRAVNETVINDMHVLIYDSSGELIGQKYQSGNTTITVDTRSAANCTVYVIANTADAELFKGYDYHSESALKEKVRTNKALILSTASNLPMSGSKKNATIRAGQIHWGHCRWHAWRQSWYSISA